MNDSKEAVPWLMLSNHLVSFRLQQIFHLLCEPWPNACFFVFEINENIIPALLCANKVSPIFDVDLIVIFTSQPQIPVICSQHFRRGEIFGVRNAKGGLSRLQCFINLVIKPGFVTELERDAHGWQFAKK